MFGKLQKEIIERGAACKQPTQEELMALFAPVSESSKKLDALDKAHDQWLLCVCLTVACRRRRRTGVRA